MRTRMGVLALALCFVTSAMSFAQDANMGTWKLNEDKSKIPAGTSKNFTVVYKVDGDKVKVTVNGVDAFGKPSHIEWIGRFDGKDYPLIGDPNADTLSYKKVDDGTLEIMQKKGGEIVTTGRIILGPNGKSRTVTTISNSASGKKVASTMVYAKADDKHPCGEGGSEGVDCPPPK